MTLLTLSTMSLLKSMQQQRSFSAGSVLLGAVQLRNDATTVLCAALGQYEQTEAQRVLRLLFRWHAAGLLSKASCSSKPDSCLAKEDAMGM